VESYHSNPYRRTDHTSFTNTERETGERSYLIAVSHQRPLLAVDVHPLGLLGHAVGIGHQR
jgi:hypothetical protein